VEIVAKGEERREKERRSGEGGYGNIKMDSMGELG
jgi:hypothetical protein